MTKILLITDSRGKGIKSRIQDHPDLSHIDWDIQIIPGATLENILKRIERGNRRNTWDHIIILAGICSFTTKTSRRNKKPYIEYKVRNTEEICNTINSLLNIGNSTHICTITPAVLQKASERQDPEVETEQLNLEEDIAYVNQHIISRNIERDTLTIDLAKLSTIRSIKKQGNKRKRIIKLNTKDLEDGVHPSISLQENWTNYIKTMVHRLTNNEDALDDDSTEEEPEPWNFKRQART